jgi:hypothetical protein
MGRTEAQIIKAARKITGLDAVKVGGNETCGVNNPNTPEAYVIFDEGFMALNAEDQDTILWHERGHLEAFKDTRSANTKLQNAYLYGFCGSDREWDRLHWAAELEADLCAAKHVGFDRVERILTNIHIIKAVERQQIRMANLKLAWDLTPRPTKHWIRRLFGR